MGRRNIFWLPQRSVDGAYGPIEPVGILGAQKRELWERWRRGQSSNDIAQALGKLRGSIYKVLSSSGGIEPAPRRRSRLALSLAEREEISPGLAEGQSMRAIAAAIQRAPSTVSREIGRHRGRTRYRATDAEQRAWARARRPKPCRLAVRRRLRQLVARKLSLNWSPEQISGWLTWRYPGDQAMQISHETIYRSLFVQARGVLKKELVGHLRTRRVIRRPRTARTRGQGRSQIVEAVSIRERPAEVDDRAVPGHWEGDLLAGSHNTHIATLVERQSRFTILVKVTSKDTQSVVRALGKQVRRLPATLRQSLTWDRGLEMAAHKEFSIATDVRVYFCDPQSPWQRGTNENTNRLLRQYFPKGTDLSPYSQADLTRTARQLNQRPRKTLAFRPPAEVFNESVALTG
jgi:IS30 family transposase